MGADEADWAKFYTGELGEVVRRALQPRLRAAWGSVRGVSILGVGYAPPHLSEFGDARRAIAAGPHVGSGAGRVCTDLQALPFTDAMFDRVLVVHALETAADAGAVLRDAARVLASSGRMLIAATARSGLWARVGDTPMRRGKSWGGAQLAGLLGLQGLEVTARTRILHTPPLARLQRRAGGLERAGAWLWPGVGGLVVIEATRRDFVRPRLRRARASARSATLRALAAPAFPVRS